MHRPLVEDMEQEERLGRMQHSGFGDMLEVAPGNKLVGKFVDKMGTEPFVDKLAVEPESLVDRLVNRDSLEEERKLGVGQHLG